MRYDTYRVCARERNIDFQNTLSLTNPAALRTDEGRLELSLKDLHHNTLVPLEILVPRLIGYVLREMERDRERWRERERERVRERERERERWREMERDGER